MVGFGAGFLLHHGHRFSFVWTSSSNSSMSSSSDKSVVSKRSTFSVYTKFKQEKINFFAKMHVFKQACLTECRPGKIVAKWKRCVRYWFKLWLIYHSKVTSELFEFYSLFTVTGGQGRRYELNVNFFNVAILSVTGD